MLKVVSVDCVNEYYMDFEFKGNGVYKIKGDEDCFVMECEIISEEEIGDLEYYVGGEFGVDSDNYEYFRVEV